MRLLHEAVHAVVIEELFHVMIVVVLVTLYFAVEVSCLILDHGGEIAKERPALRSDRAVLLDEKPDHQVIHDVFSVIVIELLWSGDFVHVFIVCLVEVIVGDGV